MVPQSRRREFYNDSQLQFRFVAMLIGLLVSEVTVFGVSLYCIFTYQRYIAPESRLLFIYVTVLSLLLVVALINAYIGIHFSHRIAGPLVCFTRSVRAITEGDLSKNVTLREDDFLSDFEADFNSMISALNEIVRADLARRETALQQITFLRHEIEKSGLPKDAKKRYLDTLASTIGSISKIGEKFVLYSH